ncbi:Arp complex subunit [Scheffersomyces xylosifermentans]|uniref:Arp complex subunit n=1 Tax=Scheffersomyces xylosifermentans TaxID=1304137 RepID=UPI00315D5B9B
MLQIEQNNLLIQKTLNERVFPDGEGHKSLDRIITDFDFTTYHISTLPDQKQLILVSIYLKCWDDLVKYGVVEYLNGKYAKYADVLSVLSSKDIESSYNYSLVLDLSQLESKDDEYKTEVIDSLSFLKRHAMAAPFEQAFARYDELAKTYANANTYSEEVQAELQNEKVLVIKYRGSDECIYIKPSFDRVTVIFSTMFQDETDKIFGKVFLQEFVDARKRSVQTAPQVLYSHKEAPLDIQNVVQGSKDDENKGYVTFVLFPRHLVKGDRRDNCISHIQFFRNYFHYHIKCSKAYMHSRMRFRVKEFLKILNRAKPENLDDEGKAIENRKTASGRRFDSGRA